MLKKWCLGSHCRKMECGAVGASLVQYNLQVLISDGKKSPTPLLRDELFQIFAYIIIISVFI
jgi:hypothetical protein